MLHLTEIRHRNSILFDDATVDLDRHPLVIVRGDNRDASRVDSPTNAVGKSLLYGAGLSVPLFNRVPASIKKSDGKSAFAENDSGTIGLSFRQGKTLYDIDVRSGKGSLKYDVRVNGRPKDFHKSVDAQKFIRRIFPLTEDLAESLVYINAREPSVLQRGKPEQRMRLFQTIFEINFYDQIHAVVARRHNAMKLDRHDLAERRRELAEVTRDFVDDPSLAERARKIADSIDLVQSRIRDHMTELRQVDAYILAAEDLDPRFGRDLDRMTRVLSSWRKMTQDHEMARTAYERSSAQWQQQQELVQQKKSLEFQIEFHQQRVRSDPPGLVESCTARLEKVEAAYKAMNDKVINFARLDLMIRGFKFDPKHAEALKRQGTTSREVTERLSGRQNDLARNQNELGRLHDLKQKVDAHRKCPTCRQDVDLDIVDRMIEETRVKGDKLRLAIQRDTRVADYLQLVEEWESCKPDLEMAWKLKKAISVWEIRTQEAKTNEARIRKLRQLKSLHAELSGIATMDQKPVPPVCRVNQDKLRALEKHVAALRRVAGLQKTYDSVGEAEQRRVELQVFVDLYTPKLEKAQKVQRSLAYRIGDADNRRGHVERLTRMVADLEAKTRDFDVLEALREFSGSKGMRVVRIRNLAEVYCKNLNRFAPLIFPEPIRFEVNIDKSTFDIIATRGAKRPLVSDVRKLCGFESSSFTLLSMLALLPLIPSRRRTNLVVFDEIETGLSRGQLDLLAREFIPQLTKVVKNVVFITPRSRQEFDVEGAHELLVVKENGISRIGGDCATEKSGKEAVHRGEDPKRRPAHPRGAAPRLDVEAKLRRGVGKRRDVPGPELVAGGVRRLSTRQFSHAA